jgi:hypothetical protein
MSKWKALIITIVCAITAVGGFTQQAYMPSLAFAVGAVLFGSIWLYKYRRDFNIVSQARLVKVKTTLKPSLPPMTSQGSRRLFVPPPIND